MSCSWDEIDRQIKQVKDLAVVVINGAHKNDYYDWIMSAVEKEQPDAPFGIVEIDKQDKECRKVLKNLGVTHLPTVVGFKGGKETQRVSPTADMRADIDALRKLVQELDPLTEEKRKCAETLPMTQWVQTKDTEKCPACLLKIPIAWYHEELLAHGQKALSDDLEKAQESGDELQVARVMDRIKKEAPEDLRQRLLDFDCSAQTFSAEELLAGEESA